MPVGFKNGTDGSVQIAIDAVRAAACPHRFLSVTKQGLAAIVATKGNTAGHVILRGASSGPNYSSEHVAKVESALVKASTRTSIVIDCSHGNSSKKHTNQPIVAADIGAQLAAGNRSIIGVMIESNLREGNQSIVDGRAWMYGQSITDACIDWKSTEDVLADLAAAVQKRSSLQDSEAIAQSSGQNAAKRLKMSLPADADVEEGADITTGSGNGVTSVFSVTDDRSAMVGPPVPCPAALPLWRMCPSALVCSRIDFLSPLIAPAIVMEDAHASPSVLDSIASSREAIREILRGTDDRLLVIVGPCSIHDVAAAKEYAARLKPLSDALASELLVVMRVYFEKPRTTVGWKVAVVPATHVVYCRADA